VSDRCRDDEQEGERVGRRKVHHPEVGRDDREHRQAEHEQAAPDEPRVAALAAPEQPDRRVEQVDQEAQVRDIADDPPRGWLPERQTHDLTPRQCDLAQPLYLEVGDPGRQCVVEHGGRGEHPCLREQQPPPCRTRPESDEPRQRGEERADEGRSPRHQRPELGGRGRLEQPVFDERVCRCRKRCHREQEANPPLLETGGDHEVLQAHGGAHHRGDEQGVGVQVHLGLIPDISGPL